MGKRILLVDDEPLILKGLKYTLEQEGYETESAMDGEEALAMFASGGFDLILLDVMLPKLDGIAVCQRIRERSDVPIIMLTAKGEDMDKILGLEYGADDYMTKPFNILEVKARIKTILRRVSSGTQQQQEHRVIRVHDMEVNLVKRSVTLGGKEVKLTAKEFDLLQMFVTNRGNVFNRGASERGPICLASHTRAWNPVGPPCRALGPLFTASWYSLPFSTNWPLAMRLPKRPISVERKGSSELMTDWMLSWA